MGVSTFMKLYAVLWRMNSLSDICTCVDIEEGARYTEKTDDASDDEPVRSVKQQMTKWIDGWIHVVPMDQEELFKFADVDSFLVRKCHTKVG